jgi:hypothetical protein
MGEEVFAELFGLIDERFFLLFDELAADGAERVDHAEIHWIRSLVEALCEDHVNLVLTHVNGEGFEVIRMGVGVVGVKLLAGVGAGFDELRKAGPEHEFLIKS